MLRTTGTQNFGRDRDCGSNGVVMTRTDLYETASQRYLQLDEKLRRAVGITEQHVLRLEIMSILDVFGRILEKMKYMDEP